jgi:hypothetical protein
MLSFYRVVVLAFWNERHRLLRHWGTSASRTKTVLNVVV